MDMTTSCSWTSASDCHGNYVMTSDQGRLRLLSTLTFWNIWDKIPKHLGRLEKTVIHMNEVYSRFELHYLLTTIYWLIDLKNH